MPSAEISAGASVPTHPTPAGACTPPAFALGDPQSLDAGEARVRLSEAARALWTATLALMTAFMQVPAPAHRYLLARRIARNLDTLAGQECFDAACRQRFARLALRWLDRSLEFAPERPIKRAPLLDLLS